MQPKNLSRAGPGGTGIECAVRVQFEAQHVIDPDMGDHRAREVRVLGQECTHQQAAIAPSFHRQSCRAGVTPLDQVPGTGREVVEDILLAGEIAVQMPLGWGWSDWEWWLGIRTSWAWQIKSRPHRQRGIAAWNVGVQEMLAGSVSGTEWREIRP
jgi:hypothetical protein